MVHLTVEKAVLRGFKGVLRRSMEDFKGWAGHQGGPETGGSRPGLTRSHPPVRLSEFQLKVGRIY